MGYRKCWPMTPCYISWSGQSGWPSGLRRCVQVAVYICRRGFESHFWQGRFWTLYMSISLIYVIEIHHGYTKQVWRYVVDIHQECTKQGWRRPQVLQSTSAPQTFVFLVHAKTYRNFFKSARIAWPSGLRRWFKAPVTSVAWVRIPPLSNCIERYKNVKIQYKGCLLTFQQNVTR